MTVAQAGERLGLSPRSVYRLISEGRLHPVRYGKRTIRLDEVEVEAFCGGGRQTDALSAEDPRELLAAHHEVGPSDVAVSHPSPAGTVIVHGNVVQGDQPQIGPVYQVVIGDALTDLLSRYGSPWETSRVQSLRPPGQAADTALRLRNDILPETDRAEVYIIRAPKQDRLSD